MIFFLIWFLIFHLKIVYSVNEITTCLNQTLKDKQNKSRKDKWTLNAGQKYCKMEHSAILLTCIMR